MNRPFRFCTLLLFALVTDPVLGQQPVALQCEYLNNPLGIDASKPRLAWKLSDDRAGAVQAAYQIMVARDSLELVKGKSPLWNSGKVVSSSQLVSYAGQPLEPFSKYYWLVRTWDEKGTPSKNSGIASFETGMMDMANWSGAWISDGQSIDVRPAPWFRKAFKTTKTILSARAYIAAAGLYEFYLNGVKQGDHMLDPMYTRFDRRNLYVTYDVTNAMSQGNNVVGIWLGNGWYNHQPIGVWDFHKAPWRNRPAFCMDLRITYTDGSVETISSGKDWKTALSSLSFNAIYAGEVYDANRHQSDWNLATFNDSSWTNVSLRAAPSTNIVAQALPPIRIKERIPFRSIRKLADTLYIADLGRNIAGVCEIRLNGRKGTKVTLKHGEKLSPGGRLDQSNIDIFYRSAADMIPFQSDTYILDGQGPAVFLPKFSYKGFQYVEISSDQPIDLRKEDLVGCFMHSDVPSAGGFNTDNPLVNQLWKATNNSYLSNLYGYPTDCPQREKNGWTGDAHIASETGLYNFDGIKVYEKWLADHFDEQQPNGVLPAIIPTGGWGYEWANGVDWTSTIVIIPWNTYLFYGDKQLLEKSYDHMKRYVDYITRQNPGGTTSWGLGDWVPVKSKASLELTSTCYYYADAVIMAKAAKLLGKNVDALHYQKLAEKIKAAFNQKFLDQRSGIYASGLQTELAMPLFWSLVPAESRQKVADNLAARVHADGDHIDVGLLGTKAILNALSENGCAELAYQLASNETYPSWGWWIKNGATTLFENWPVDAKNDISMNHIMFGEIGAWFYKALAGIKPDEKLAGFRKVIIEPHFVKGLNKVEAWHDSPFGRIGSSWERVKGNIQLSLIIPAGTSAELRLPGITANQVLVNGKQVKTVNSITLQSGKHQIQIKE
ncbi:glycoside hydrolase family 78 protein [Flavihumibacter rivuli]|uniref:alpha-L-rhamnosidase n=1 Tax=Flavihumibacter rivuli TaxID=2838156 RepID=UPI001BDDDF72|nr:alpha-L-rhamnosidase [Flavihumibacter rivuli]ULQ55668.1 glycoside hydrolase family 78 protein [Flavihumibacter rivuli]